MPPEHPNEDDAGGLPSDKMQEVCDAIYAGRKIPAIKAYRELTGKGLKESKDFVEALEVRLRAETPERFTSPPGGKGCGTVLLAVVAVIAIVFKVVPDVLF